MAEYGIKSSAPHRNNWDDWQVQIKMDDGSLKLFTKYTIADIIENEATDLLADIDLTKIIESTVSSLFDGIEYKVFENTLVLAIAQFVELDNAYSLLAARMLNRAIYHEVVGFAPTKENYATGYKMSFIETIHKGIELAIFDKKLLEFDLEKLSQHIDVKRDQLFHYLGLRTLYTRYLKKFNNVRFEMPQAFWMRIAMALAMNEERKHEKAIEFYNIISSMLFVPSTPTLLHAGHVHAQLSSCYLTYVDDELSHIFKCIADNAQMSKWSGGVANDWTSLRATGSLVKSINTPSQGVIPFLKVADSTTASINRSGSRRGAVCAYLEAWHYDFEDFLDLRRNTGDERRRTHDMNTAAWLPDLFMKRVESDGDWTFFSPNEVPGLHDAYGKKFEAMYVQYEQDARDGKIALFRVTSAKKLWRKLLTRLFETGHPWPTFKDACNVRSPQDHVGVVHSSNLCTEITLNTSRDETAVCNLGSINLSKFVDETGHIDDTLLAKTVKSAMRMLDNVIDLNFYPTVEGYNANSRHRPVGLGMMGLQDAIFKAGYAFDSEEAMDLSDELTESISYHAILTSSQLAQERGSYSSYKGSKWDRNFFPIDTIDLLAQERGMEIPKIGKIRKDWSIVRDHVKTHGMRNSNTMAIAPTATISNISGCYPCIEPIYKNLYAKSNSSGDFPVVNGYLIKELKALNLWNETIRDKIKYFDGSIQNITEIPQKIRDKYKTAFEINPLWMVYMTAARGKWIDQSQSHNVFMQGVSGTKLHDLYMAGWKAGLKTFYYLRTLGASQIEKNTLDAKTYGFTQMREYQQPVENNMNFEAKSYTVASDEDIEALAKKSCSLTDPDCESCQ